MKYLRFFIAFFVPFITRKLISVHHNIILLLCNNLVILSLFEHRHCILKYIILNRHHLFTHVRDNYGFSSFVLILHIIFIYMARRIINIIFIQTFYYMCQLSMNIKEAYTLSAIIYILYIYK